MTLITETHPALEIKLPGGNNGNNDNWVDVELNDNQAVIIVNKELENFSKGHFQGCVHRVNNNPNKIRKVNQNDMESNLASESIESMTTTTASHSSLTTTSATSNFSSTRLSITFEIRLNEEGTKEAHRMIFDKMNNKQ
eukprot:Awhi_evm1s4337